MYKAGITDERSVLMFLCSIGVESEYGTRWTERYNKGGVVVGEGYTMSTRGAGLIQVTGDTQQVFMEYLYKTLPHGAERNKVKRFLDGYDERADGDLINTYGSATDFIAENYVIESAIWFWSVNTETVAMFDGDQQTDMTINEFIESFSDMNQDNVFLAMQYAVNGRQGLPKGDLEDICNTTENVITGSDNKMYFEGTERNLPNGWKDRKGDWENEK